MCLLLYIYTYIIIVARALELSAFLFYLLSSFFLKKRIYHSFPGAQFRPLSCADTTFIATSTVLYLPLPFIFLQARRFSDSKFQGDVSQWRQDARQVQTLTRSYIAIVHGLVKLADDADEEEKKSCANVAPATVSTLATPPRPSAVVIAGLAITGKTPKHKNPTHSILIDRRTSKCPGLPSYMVGPVPRRRLVCVLGCRDAAEQVQTTPCACALCGISACHGNLFAKHIITISRDATDSNGRPVQVLQNVRVDCFTLLHPQRVGISKNKIKAVSTKSRRALRRRPEHYDSSSDEANGDCADKPQVKRVKVKTLSARTQGRPAPVQALGAVNKACATPLVENLSSKTRVAPPVVGRGHARATLQVDSSDGSDGSGSDEDFKDYAGK